ncbi:VCBS repeat-containing protein [Archangium violaceum]|uniref:FG-GAP-like repeat-containing protein n=1 Tax=Archangium violaceum TaxID=83451 RepID=UPI00193C6F2A|nr:FG-GAP-like repeat-containing protein [Archangium violaceum]QRK06877.1 VCBS repeat-containing protein [Archangium violaceum]
MRSDSKISLLRGRSMMRWLGAASMACTLWGCGPQPEEALPGSETATALGQTGDSLYVDRGSIWSTLSIPVCWENPGAGSVADRDIVRLAVANTWEANSDVDFTGWGTCGSSSGGIRIRISDEGPHTKGLGDSLDGVTNGMVLNFTFANWSPSCQQDRQGCIRKIAVHEFGHALGFAHEQNRPDTPSWCDQEQGSDGDIMIGSWDLSSVMNYCNPQWNGNGALSGTDILGLRAYYLGWQMSSGGSGLWQSLNASDYNLPDLRLYDFNGDGKTDVFRADGWRWWVSYSGTGAWTLINASEYTLGSLGFGDFNGDGKTDVFRADGSRFWVSYSGTGTWTQLNASGYTLGSLRFGDFNGDGRADIFRADGSRFWVSYSGTGAWTQLNSSEYTLSSLRFGDFNGDGRTDIFRADGSRFWVSYSGSGTWSQLNASEYTLGSLAFGDFNGDGRTDIFRADGARWWVSYSGSSGWSQLNSSGYLLSRLGFGDFTGDGRTDVMLTRN